MGVHNIKTNDEFHKAIAENKAVAVDFYATWCAPCKAIAPVFAHCSELDKFKDVLFLKFDVDDLSDLAATLGVRTMPTFKLFLNGEAVEEVQGAKQEELIAMLEKAI